jgi:hypothetical protein
MWHEQDHEAAGDQGHNAGNVDQDTAQRTYLRLPARAAASNAPQEAVEFAPAASGPPGAAARPRRSFQLFQFIERPGQ